MTMQTKNAVTNIDSNPLVGDTMDQKPCYRTLDLFQGNQTVYIEHEGQIYNLKITRQKKLLLTK